jgi:hypothetical protein
MPYQTLGKLFGISHETASTYYEELLDLFHEELVGRLLYPLSADQTKEITPEEFEADLPDVLVIWDATGLGGCAAIENIVFGISSPIRRISRVWLCAQWQMGFSIKNIWRDLC